MKSTVWYIETAAIALLAAIASGPASAQQSKGQLYAYHTSAVVGGCPGLDWHITVEPDNKLIGFVAWDRGVHLARLDGSISKDRSFEMAAAEVGGAERKATVKGSATGDYINVSIYGSGTPCDGIILPIPRTTGETAGGG